jgi:hypothetical protein
MGVAVQGFRVIAIVLVHEKVGYEKESLRFSEEPEKNV